MKICYVDEQWVQKVTFLYIAKLRGHLSNLNVVVSWTNFMASLC